MSAARIGEGLAAAAAGAAAMARARGVAAIAGRAMPAGVVVEAGEDSARLRGAGLLVRVFGSRRRGADPAVVGWLAQVRSGDGG